MTKHTRLELTKLASFVLTYICTDPVCVPNQSVGLNHSNVNFNLIRNVSICSLHIKPSWSLNFMGSSSFLRSNNSIQFHTKNRRESKSAENSHVAPAGVSGRRLWVQKKTENMEKGNFPNDTPLSPCCPLLNPQLLFFSLKIFSATSSDLRWDSILRLHCMLGWQRLNSTEVARSKSRNFFSTPALLAPAPVRFVCSSSEKCASWALITLASAGRGQDKGSAEVLTWCFQREKGSQLKPAFPSIPTNRNRYRGNVKIMSSHTCWCSAQFA